MSKEKHSFLDKVLHPKSEEESEPMIAEEKESPKAEEKKASKKSSVGAAPSEGKHHHKKFDKFKKGN